MIAYYNSFVAGDDISVSFDMGYDLTGYTATSKMESDANITIATFDADLTDTVLTLTLDAATSIGVTAGKYLWEAKLVSPLGATETVARGIVEVLETT